MPDPFHPESPNHGPREPSFRISTPQLGVIILFVSIGVLFAASLVAYLITRAQVPNFRPGHGGLPAGLFASTLLLAGTSFWLEWALSGLRQNRQETFMRGLWLAAVFAGAFLVGQALNWTEVVREEMGYQTPTLFAFTFYFLTGVHAAHVLGGLIPLGIVLHRASRREYSSSRSEGVRLCVQYWHYLGVIWLILLVTMIVAT